MTDSPLMRQDDSPVEIIERAYKTGDCEACGCIRRLTLVREGRSIYTSALHDLCAECLVVLDA